MGKSYNPNRNKDGQFATGPKTPADPANRELSPADIARAKNEGLSSLVGGSITSEEYFETYGGLAEAQKAIYKAASQLSLDDLSSWAATTETEPGHYRYRPAFQEEDICPTCTSNDMQNIINWPCKYADPSE